MDFAKSVGLKLLKSATAKIIGKKLINYGTAYVGRKIVGDLTKKSNPKPVNGYDWQGPLGSLEGPKGN